MIDKSKMEQQREADRRLALLALVSEQPEPCGACLEPEELSALIEGRLTPEQIEPCLTHLAGCERCYALWLRLDREWRGQTGRSNRNTLRRLISRPRVLAAAGSLLAAAASIAVFLNITVDHRALPRLPEKAAQEQALSMPAAKTADQVAPEQAPAPPAASSLQSANEQMGNLAVNQADKPTDRQTVAPRVDDAKHRSRSTASQALDQELDQGRNAAKPAQPKATAPTITAQGEKKAEQSPTTAAKRITPITPRTPVAPAGEAPNQVAPLIADQQAVQSEETAATFAGGEAVPSSAPQPALRAAAAPPAAEKAEAAPLTYAAWQTALRQGCQGQPGPHFFETIRNDGAQLLRQSANLPKQKRRRIERVLALIGGSQTPAQQCRAMLDTLGPEAPTPRP